MSHSRHFQSALLALSVLAAFSLPAALAQPGNTAGPSSDNAPKAHAWGHKKHKGCGMMKQLNLSDEQRQQLKTMRENFKNNHQADIERMKARHAELKQLRNDPDANKEQIAALKAEMKNDWQKHSAERRAELQKVLTPEQFSQFETLRQQCKAQHGGGKGKRRGQGGQGKAGNSTAI